MTPSIYLAPLWGGRGAGSEHSVVFNSGQKMALRAFYFIRALTYYYIRRSQRHLLAAIENNWFGVPIITTSDPKPNFSNIQWVIFIDPLISWKLIIKILHSLAHLSAENLECKIIQFQWYALLCQKLFVTFWTTFPDRPIPFEDVLTILVSTFHLLRDERKVSACVT